MCSRGDIGRGNRGVFIAQNNGTTVSIAQVVDGTSNTILLAEAVIGDPGSANRMRGGFVINVSGAQSESANGPASACWALRGSNGMYTTSGYTSSSGADMRGRRWGGAHPHYTQFNTIIPPNGPSCSADTSAGQWGMLGAATSMHSGGVNVALADASVRFISETIDANPANFGTTYSTNHTGKSPFGVWGALGSKDGGETTTL